MSYQLFLFDLDDTLLDFKRSEQLAFYSTLQRFGVTENLDLLFQLYQKENLALWTRFEKGTITKDRLKVERFEIILRAHHLPLDPVAVSIGYLDALPESVVHIDYAQDLCEWLSHRGEIGIITNGIHSVATRRIAKSLFAPYLSFVCVSETCGFAKPDIRFFEHCVTMASTFSKESTLVIGDKLETDIAGAQAFGVDSCWFNPSRITRTGDAIPKFEISHLSHLPLHLESLTSLTLRE